MASEIQFRGESMVYSVISRLLLRGYNSAKPIFDEGDGDDFWVALKGSKDPIRRIQVKSLYLKKSEKEKNTESFEAKIQIPQSILDGAVDIVVIGLWNFNHTFIGLFDGTDIRTILKNGIGGTINRKTKTPHSPHFSFRFTVSIIGTIPKITCTKKLNVTHHFTMENGRWDELFPTRFPKSTEAKATRLIRDPFGDF
jgi:hypothetical protein